MHTIKKKTVFWIIHCLLVLMFIIFYSKSDQIQNGQFTGIVKNYSHIFVIIHSFIFGLVNKTINLKYFIFLESILVALILLEIW